METTVTPKQAARSLEYLIAAKQPAILWGAPGIGKSQIVAQTAAALGMQLQDVRAVLLDPVDLRGLPHVNGDGRAHWAIPEFLPRDGSGLLFLDELNRAPVLVQNACFQLVLDRKLGEYRLPDEWVVIAACNRESDGGGVSKMPSALCNRFTHLELTVDINDWCQWASKAGIEPVVIAFLRFRSELLHAFDRNARAFPSPRAWEFVSRIVATNAPVDIMLQLVAGCVGQAAAIEFMAYMRLWKSLPNIDAILLNPSGAPVPNEVSALYAVATGLGRVATANNLGRVITYLERLPDEYNVLSVRDAITRESSLAASPEYTQWCIRHSDVTM